MLAGKRNSFVRKDTGAELLSRRRVHRPDASRGAMMLCDRRAKPTSRPANYGLDRSNALEPNPHNPALLNFPVPRHLKRQSWQFSG